MSSLIPVAVVAGVWYHLARQGIATTIVWLSCNLLDTLRALRVIRPNGRAVGQRTRRRAIRDSLICWISFITIQQFGAIPDKLLSWLPVYSLVRTLVVVGFLLARVSASETIYNSIIQPTLKRYETPIDLTIELVSSIILLVYHFTLQYPVIKIQTALEPYTARITSLLRSKQIMQTPTPAIEELLITPPQTDDTLHTPVDVDMIDESEATSLPGTSKTQRLIAECEKRSPLRPTAAALDGRLRTQATRPTASSHKSTLPQSTSTKASVQPTRRVQASKQTAPTMSASTSTSREPPRPAPRLIASRERPRRDNTTDQPHVQRTAPTVKDTNIRAEPPLVKSKSSINLKPKPYITDIIPQRTIKSAPTRRTVGLQVTEGTDSPRSKRLAQAAERAKEIRERRRREPGPTPGEKRPPPLMSVKDAPGSKRTRMTVARD